MAASVLGKRTRQSCNASEVAPASPAKRRQTRQSAPTIYEDVEPTEPKRVLSRRSLKSCIQTVKNTVSNKNTQCDENEEISSKYNDASKENLPPVFLTPSSQRFKDALSTASPFTPRRRVLLGGKLVTPRSQRTVAKDPSRSIYAAARQLFSQSGNQNQIVGRQQERDQLKNFISTGINSQNGGCLYISGPPGTGKSALVLETLQAYKADDHVKISMINCVTSQSTSDIASQLSQDFETPLKNIKDCGKLFTAKPSGAVHIVLMDEIDNLLNGDCELLYSMFEWALHRSSSLLLIGIANALDLTDRFMPRLKARNLKPQLLPFLPYAAADMSNIITSKLRTLLPAAATCAADFVPVIHPAAVKLIGSKIAAQTGDLRKAFSLARRCIEQIDRETQENAQTETRTPTKQPLGEISNGLPTPSRSSPSKTESSSSSVLSAETAPRASIQHVARLATSIFSHGAVARLSGLNLQQKAVLCSLVAVERRQISRDPFKTPSKSAQKIPDVRELYEGYGRMCQNGDGLLPVLKNTEFRDVVASLETLGLLHEAIGRGSSMLTPSKTPSRTGKNIDERRYVSAVSESEMRDSLEGPGGDLLRRFMD